MVINFRPPGVAKTRSYFFSLPFLSRIEYLAVFAIAPATSESEIFVAFLAAFFTLSNETFFVTLIESFIVIELNFDSLFKNPLFGDTLLPKAAASATLKIPEHLDPLQGDHPTVAKRHLFRSQRNASGATTRRTVRATTNRAMPRNARRENITASRSKGFRVICHRYWVSPSKEKPSGVTCFLSLLCSTSRKTRPPARHLKSSIIHSILIRK